MRLLIPALLVCWAQLLAAGEVEMIPAQIDFGVKPQHQILEAHLKFVNTGTRQIAVSSLQGSCDCTLGEIDRKLVGPGQTAQIRLRLNSGDFEGDIERRLVVHTSAGDIAIPIRAAICQYPNWIVNPGSLSLGQIAAGQTLRSLSIRYVGPKSRGSYHPTATVAESPSLAVESGQRGGAETEFVLKSKAGAKRGAVRGFMVIATGDPATPEIWVRVTGYVNSQVP